MWIYNVSGFDAIEITTKSGKIYRIGTDAQRELEGRYLTRPNLLRNKTHFWTMYPVTSKNLNRETKTAVYFYTPAFDALNNFSAHQVEIWGIHFPTAEHAYQWKKFADSESSIAKKILEAGSPEAAQRIAHKHKTLMPKDWHEKKVEIMEDILRAKRMQHRDVRDALTRSGKRNIIENSPVDAFWGCGPAGDGKNMMGELWMIIRASD